jgi:sugar lactone lactonase YvrE
MTVTHRSSLCPHGLFLTATLAVLAGCSGGGGGGGTPATNNTNGNNNTTNNNGGVNQNVAFTRLWVPNYNLGQVRAWNQARLAADVDGTPDIAISLPAGAHPNAIAFDATNAMWVTDNTGSRLFKFGHNQLTQSGSPVPQVTINTDGNSLAGPIGLCFDHSDNLWVAVGGWLEMYQPDNLDQSGPTTPNKRLRADGFDLPADIQFDAAGNLWVSNASSLVNLNAVYVFTPAQQAAGDAQVPLLRITSPSFALVEGMRFDSRGDLWVSCNDGMSVTRFAAAAVALPAAPAVRQLTPGGSLESDANDTQAGRTVRKPGGLVFDRDGNLFVNSERLAAADASAVLQFRAAQVANLTGGQTLQANVLIARSTSNPGFGGLALER